MPPMPRAKHGPGEGAWAPVWRSRFLLLADFCYSAWLTSIVFCASNGCRPLLIASATFFPVGIVHGVGVWFGGW